MEFDRQVTISDKVNLFFEAHLQGRLNGNVATLDLSSKEINLINIEGYDFLDSLFKLRQLLEEKQLFILCQGSVTNVHPSRMARDMSSGLKAYSLVLGKKAAIEQLVEIFDPVPAERVGLIIEQSAFWEKWINTPRN